jgi:hypothetical protein
MHSFNLRSIFFWLTVYSIAMGFLESAVVVYLREILYPAGFDFPMKAIPSALLIPEIIREAATLIMLLAVGILAGRNHKERFAWFIFCFGIWDIFYYVFLKCMIGWPDSLFTWDILFLIPVAWTGPVLAPVIVSLIMIALAVILIESAERKPIKRVRQLSVALIGAGAILVFIAFIWDYMSFIIKITPGGRLPEKVMSPAGAGLLFQYVPDHFNWLLFFVGIAFLVFGMIMLYFGNREKQPEFFAGAN